MVVKAVGKKIDLQVVLVVIASRRVVVVEKFIVVHVRLRMIFQT